MTVGRACGSLSIYKPISDNIIINMWIGILGTGTNCSDFSCQGLLTFLDGTPYTHNGGIPRIIVNDGGECVTLRPVRQVGDLPSCNEEKPFLCQLCQGGK